MLRHPNRKGMAVLAALVLSGCGGNVAIRVEHVPPQPAGAPAAAAAVRVLEFRDERPGTAPNSLGRLSPSLFSTMSDVTAQRPVNEIVTEAVRAELASAGHRLVAADEAVTVSGSIRQFSVGTPAVGAMYWDVVADVSLSVEFRPVAAGSPVVTGTYEARATQRSYVSPGEKLLKETLERALGEAMKLMRADPAIARALSPRS